MNTTAIRRTTAATLAAGTLTAGLLVAGAPSALAKGDDGVSNSGACSTSSTWELKAKHDDGLIEVEFEVDSNVAGQTWAVRIRDNGVRVFAGQRVTKGRSGSFSVERKVADRAGADRFVGVATNAATGETCRGTVTLPA